MAGGKIYLRAEGGLVAMSEARYDAEEELQILLADYPDLLAGDQMRPGAPRRWLLVTREAGVPDSAGAQPRWFLDHLFLDQDAVPTLIEVKRSTNTQIRREVVGQMLDYAANVVEHWPAGQIRALFEERARASGSDPDAQVRALLEVAPDDEGTDVVGDFWVRAASNLATRQIRLVFVADVIPPELQRIVEFLNENLVRTEVLAVEVKQYVGQGRQTLVPRVIGRTATAEEVKATASGTSHRSWTETEFLDAAHSAGLEAERLVSASLEWLAEHGVPVTIGRGRFGPLYLSSRNALGDLVDIADVNSVGRVELLYARLAKSPPFDAKSERLEANLRFNKIPGVNLAERPAIDATWPSIRPEALAGDDNRRAFLAVLDWVAGRLAESKPSESSMRVEGSRR
jgi:hypothetical protein